MCEKCDEKLETLNKQFEGLGINQSLEKIEGLVTDIAAMSILKKAIVDLKEIGREEMANKILKIGDDAFGPKAQEEAGKPEEVSPIDDMLKDMPPEVQKAIREILENNPGAEIEVVKFKK